MHSIKRIWLLPCLGLLCGVGCSNADRKELAEVKAELARAREAQEELAKVKAELEATRRDFAKFKGESESARELAERFLAFWCAGNGGAVRAFGTEAYIYVATKDDWFGGSRKRNWKIAGEKRSPDQARFWLALELEPDGGRPSEKRLYTLALVKELERWRVDSFKVE
jgi:hypothetical protein